MKTVTYDQLLKFDLCEKLERYAPLKPKWSASDILALKDVPSKDKLWAVLREELIDAPILHEFACRCAEAALAKVENPDPRSLAAIEAKRKWLRGEVSDEERQAAQVAAWDATRRLMGAADGTAAESAACAAMRAAGVAAEGAAAWGAAYIAKLAAKGRAEWDAAWDTAWDAERDNQCKMLVEMLPERHDGAGG